MSAYVVEKGHIDYLIACALRTDHRGFDWYNGARHTLEFNNASHPGYEAAKLGAP